MVVCNECDYWKLEEDKNKLMFAMCTFLNPPVDVLRIVRYGHCPQEAYQDNMEHNDVPKIQGCH